MVDLDLRPIAVINFFMNSSDSPREHVFDDRISFQVVEAVASEVEVEEEEVVVAPAAAVVVILAVSKKLRCCIDCGCST